MLIGHWYPFQERTQKGGGGGVLDPHTPRFVRGLVIVICMARLAQQYDT